MVVSAATAQVTPPSPPLITIRNFLDGAQGWGEATSVRLRGTVTLSTSDRTYFIQDGDAGVYVFHKPQPALRVGELVEVVGQPSLGGVVPSLQNCTAKVVGTNAVPAARSLTGATMLEHRNLMVLVQLRGRLTGGLMMGGRVMVLKPEDGSQPFEVNLEALPKLDTLPLFEAGSLIEATGVLNARLGPDRKVAGSSILIRSAADLAVVAGPPFWTERRVTEVLLGITAVLVLALVWAWTLRRQVRRQSVILEKRFERELALRASEDRFAKVFRANPDPMIMTRAADGQILDVNPAFEKLTGYPRAEVVGRRADETGLWHRPEDGEKLVRELQEKGSVSNFDCRLRSRSGQEIEWLLSAEWIELNGERCWLGVARDLTERIRLESQLRQAQKMEALGTLSGGIAHDFNNILGAILGNAELARQDVNEPHPARECLDEIRKAAVRARDLVTQILDFSRKQRRERRLLALQSTIEEAARLLRATMPATIEITTTIDPQCPPVVADPGRIHQVVMNLGTNGWHAMENRPGHLKIDYRGVVVDSALTRNHPDLRSGPHACLSVSDTGAGMDTATRERIFEPFFTTKAPGQGTGLGLAAVHGIVKDHEGMIVVESELQRGSTFAIYLPALGVAPDINGAPTTRPELPRGSGQHVLLIDDEAALVGVLKRMMERLGYRVTAYTQPGEAVQAFQANPSGFDLVLTDLNMPGTTGLGVITQLRQLRHELPAVLTSGFISEEQRTRALEAGTRAIIHKPISVDELAEVLHRLLPATRGQVTGGRS